MVVQKRHCRGCGCEYELKDEGQGKCPYCGTVLESNLLNSTLDEILFNARALRRVGNFRAARKEYMRVLDQNPGIKEAHFGLFLCDYGVTEYRLEGGQIAVCQCTSCSKIATGQNENFLNAIDNSANREIWQKIGISINNQRKLNVKIQKNMPAFSALLLCDPNNEADVECANEIYELLSEKIDIFYPMRTLANIDTALWDNYIRIAVKDTNAMFVISSEPASKLQNSIISPYYREFRDLHEDYQMIAIVPDSCIIPGDMFDDPDDATCIDYDSDEPECEDIADEMIDQLKSTSWTFSERGTFRREGKLFFNDNDSSPILEPLTED